MIRVRHRTTAAVAVILLSIAGAAALFLVPRLQGMVNILRSEADQGQHDLGPAHPYSPHFHLDRLVFYPASAQARPPDRVEHVSKWSEDFSVCIWPATRRAMLDEFVPELALLTGRRISIKDECTSEKRGADLRIIVAPRAELDFIMSDVPLEQRRWGYVACLSQTAEDAGRIVGAFVAIPAEYSESFTRHCILHELLHGLGFRGHSDIVENSTLGERSSPLIELPLNDKIIVRTLYDPRITPGMPRRKALEVAREVIGELVAGVRRDGVEALYQRPGRSPLP